MFKISRSTHSTMLVVLLSALLSACGATSTTAPSKESVQTTTTTSEPVIQTSTDSNTGIITETRTTITTETDIANISTTINVVTTTNVTTTITDPSKNETTSSTNSTSNTVTLASELDRAIEHMVDQTIVPNINDFQVQVHALNQQVTAFCTDNSLNNLNLTQDQWITTHTSWYQVAPFIFGPLDVANALTVPVFWYIDSYRNNGRDYTQEVRSSLTGLISSSTLVNDINFADMNYNQVGLLAMEVALFERSTDQSQTAADIFNEFSNTPRKCDILKAYSQELLRYSTLTQQSWNSNYQQTGKSYRDLLLNNQLEDALDNESGDPAISKITVAVQEFYDYMNKRNVSTQVAKLSHSTKQALLASANITESLFSESVEPNLSIYALMSKNGHEQDRQTITTNIQTFIAAINNGTDEEIKSAAAAIDGNLKRELPSALNVSLGLNFTDGD
jgi:predicted lipoprotein